MDIPTKSVALSIGSYVSSVKEKQKAEAPTDVTKEQKPREDTVELSDKAREIQDAKKAINAISDVRDEKVAEIKNQVENGTYKVNAEGIASGMVEESFTSDRALRVDVKA